MTAIFCLVFIPQPASFEYDIWKLIAEYAAIPILAYIFRHAFTSRSEVNNKAVKALSEGMDQAKEAITKLQSADEMMEYRLNEEVKDRRDLGKEFRDHKEEVLRGFNSSINRGRKE